MAFRVKDREFIISGLGLRVEGVGLAVKGLGYRV